MYLNFNDMNILMIFVLVLISLFGIGVLFMMIAPILLRLEQGREQDLKRKSMTLFDYAKTDPSPRTVEKIKKISSALGKVWLIALAISILVILIAYFNESG